MAHIFPGAWCAGWRRTGLAIVFLIALLLRGACFAQAGAASAGFSDPANLAGERVSAQDPADTLPINHGAAALQQLLLKLRTRASLMMIVAHPDDEDGGMLTYESRGQGARVAMLTLTRGEGGQNLMTADFNDALGLIRTQELLAADRYFGVDQMFGTEVDFGFSKTKEETLAKWTHERVLYDAVRAVRLYRPLVIASVFVGGPTDGHGHHQVAGEIAQEVFLAAADPNVYPEMIKEGLAPWAALKVYARVPFSRVTPDGMYDYATGRTIPTSFHNYVTGADSTVAPTATVIIHEGDKPSDPTLAQAMGGDSYVQFARKGLALQKTQIGPNARLAAPGAFDAGYTLIASRLVAPRPVVGEESFFDGIDTSVKGIGTLVDSLTEGDLAGLRELSTSIEHIASLADEPHSGVSRQEADGRTMRVAIQDALRSVNALISRIERAGLPYPEKQNVLHELRIKRVQLNDALVLALDVSFRPQLVQPTQTSNLVELTANQVLTIDAHFAQPVGPDLKIEAATLDAQPGMLQQELRSELNTTVRVRMSAAPPPSEPYFFRRSSEQPFYDLRSSDLRNAASAPASLVEVLSLAVDGVPFEMRANVQFAQNSASVSAIAVPLFSVKLSPGTGILPIAQQSAPVSLQVLVRASSARESGTVSLDVPAGWRVEPASVLFVPSRPGEELPVVFHLLPPANLRPGEAYTVTAAVRANDREYTDGFRPVGYSGLSYTNLYTPATYRATAVDVTTAPKLRVAYLPGTGDTVSDFLSNLGVNPTRLTPADLTAAGLAQYDAVLLGVRAYAAHPELANSSALLDYARAGGVVIVQYNTARFGDAQSPYPIEVPGDPAHNVVEEADPVTLLAPKHPVLNWPNKITSKDFTGWNEELGHGFAATWDPHFVALTETHDPGQDPQRGGLLYARTGRGAYTYCAYALYRQLPEGVPGAYRLLANLISLSRNREALPRPAK